jgi:hypothetical protein
MAGKHRRVAGWLLVGGIAAGVAASPPLIAQAPARAESSDAAVAALVSEVRALRADMAAASRNQLRAQLLLGRVQMQEQRLAYLDKQRSDAAAAIMMQSQMTSALRGPFGARADSDGCSKLPSVDARNDCEANVTMMRRQLAEQEAREQQLKAHENELTDALSAEQARWSEFNSRLDELERTLR